MIRTGSQMENKLHENVSKKVKGPKEQIRTRRAGKLYKARSRLYRSHILQVNMRLKALAEIYTMHSFAQLQNHMFSKTNARKNFAKICEIFQQMNLLILLNFAKL